MSKARLIVMAVELEKRPVAEVAAAYGVARSWAYKVLARYRLEGETAFEPRSRRPLRSPNATSPTVVELVLRLRQELTGQGLDAGAHTICWHAEHHHGLRLAPATVWRILTRHGQVTPEPKKRPKASYIRFQADFPNQMWQTDFTHWHLTTGPDVEILNFLDDHSRYLLACVAFPRVTGPAVVATFRQTLATHGVPASVLSDNGMVFTTRFAGNRHGAGGRNGFEHELAAHGVIQKNSSPNHPQTCGKVERFHQTLKKWLTRQPAAATLPELQAQLDTFRVYYNSQRPHRALDRRTPAAAYTARPKASPAPAASPDTHERIRHDRIDDTGAVTIRYHGRLHHIGVGRTHARTHVILLIQDRNIRIIARATGELLRELILDPTKDYQPQNARQTEP